MAELNEIVAEAAEEVADHADHVAAVSRALSGREVRIAGISALIGLAAGAAIGYFVASRRLAGEFAADAQREIDDMRDHFDKKLDAVMGRVDKPELDKVVSALGYTSDDGAEKVEGPVIGVKETTPSPVRNIFEESAILDAAEALPDPSPPPVQDVWDYATEIKSRDPRNPYIIHKDEYKENGREYMQSTLTYYMDDDVLADERDGVIDDQDDAVGVQHLDKFGHGSCDPNIVYVRNEVREIDYEIIRSNGSYAEEVHGFRHSDASRRRRDWDG